MSTATGERLYGLLPAIYRVRDAGQGEPLRALLAVLERELERLEGDIEGLYDNWFIETCAEWVVPYVGDLLGVRGVLPAQGAPSAGGRRWPTRWPTGAPKAPRPCSSNSRATSPGGRPGPWSSSSCWRRRSSSQNVRAGKGGTVNVRDASRVELVGGPFERAAHLADVRHIDNGRGRYNIPHVGLFLWRLQSYVVPRSTARAVAEPSDGRYVFHPAGVSAPLFNRSRTETAITELALEANVPGPLRRRPLYDELEARRQAQVDARVPHGSHFATQPVLQVFVDGFPVPPEQVTICNLGDPPSPTPEGWRRPPSSKDYTPAEEAPLRTCPCRSVSIPSWDAWRSPAAWSLAWSRSATPTGSPETSAVGRTTGGHRWGS